jgi:hypothetical protein
MMSQRNKTRFGIFLILLISLVSCGKKGKSTSTNQQDNPELLASGPSISGTFFDSAVKGLTYRPTKSTESNITNSHGEFRCRSGEEVDFNVGSLLLGRVECLQLVTPETMFQDPASAVNLGMLLLALDENGNPDDGIKLPLAIQNQKNETGILSNIISDNSAVVELTERIIADAPYNTFLGGGKLSTIEEVRTHFDASIMTIGRYSGAIRSLEISQPEGNCNYTKTLTVDVKTDSVIISGFGAFVPSEVTFTLPRLLHSASGTSSFDGTLELPSLDSVESLNGENGRIYSQIRFNESLIDEVLYVKYQAGNVKDDGSFNALCTGTIELNRDVKINDFVIMRKTVKKLPAMVGNIINISNAADFGTQITQTINNLAPVHNNLYNCILAQNDANETRLNCTGYMNEAVEKSNNAAILINKRKLSDPRISDELVMMANNLAWTVMKLDALFNY